MKNFLANFLRSEDPKFSDQFRNDSYSQCGEDRIIEYLLSLRKIAAPTYIDLGANHPYFYNNSARFYDKGSAGINVEANSQLLGLYKTYRPRDTNLNFGVGVKEGKMDFYCFEDDTLSTFSAKEADLQKASGKKILNISSIDIFSLDYIIQKFANGIFPDILSIDVEGVDFEIMKSTDFTRSKPKVICAETADYSPIGAGPKRADYMEFIQSLGYYLYADTNLNSIFVDSDFWFNYRNE